MIKINGRIFERADYCKILPSGSPQICTEDATNIITETGEIFSLDAVIETVSIDSVADMENALEILGVTE